MPYPAIENAAMSYDVNMHDAEGRALGSHNYTYNVSKLFAEHLIVGPKRGMDCISGLPGREAGPILHLALERIETTRVKLWVNDVPGEPVFCRLYDAPNGWGSALGGILFLSLIMADCFENPDALVTVS